MAATTATLLDRRTLSADEAITAAEAPDLGDGQTLEIVVTVHEAAEGDSPALALLHAPEADGDWLPFEPPVRVPLGRTGRAWIHVPRFTRYVGWQVMGGLETSPTVSVKLVAKA